MDMFEKTGRCPGLDYVVGPLAADVSRLSVIFTTSTATEPVTISGKTVRVTHSTGGVGIATSILAAPKGLAPSVGFFVGRVPCGVEPKAIHADGHSSVTTPQWPGGEPLAGFELLAPA
jgi:hypothetical protein